MEAQSCHGRDFFKEILTFVSYTRWRFYGKLLRRGGKEGCECVAAMRVWLMLSLAACGVCNPKVSISLCHFHFH